jgi:hypothetical protein
MYPRGHKMRMLSFLTFMVTAYAFTFPSFLGTPAERYVNDGMSRVENDCVVLLGNAGTWQLRGVNPLHATYTQ